ncbi:ArsR family transcriptional regulator [Mycobacterium sp. 050128]|uniref:arsenate reductase/protein-tyrosine-phosphatase family protein n=1 Tax=unclassified Mycobacterium TaxID=2642494 RepID=UPI002ED81566
MATTDRMPVPLLMQMASHPLRWALLTELASSDRRVRELVVAVDAPQNLVSYHLRLLRVAGLVATRRSSFDGRDSYYHLELARCAAAFGDAATALHPALAPAVAARAAAGKSVLFVCTGNSARSPMAEGLLRLRGTGRVRVTSAGSHPKPRLHPNAVRVMREAYGIDIGRRRPKSLTAVAERRFDYVITLCDKVREFPYEHGSAAAMHWSLPDPSAGPAGYRQFRRVAAELDTRIGFLLPVLAHATEG